MSALNYDDLQLPYFMNSRLVGMVGGMPITVTDAINAAQLARNNVFVAGKKGAGKTQLLFDLRSRFGDKGLIIEGRPDLRVDDLFKHINLHRLREGASSDEVYELGRSVQARFIGVDELNRAPEVVQNELLSVMNGYILHKGYPIPLGDGFSVGLGTGNLGNGGYVGTFRIDDALADRLHLFMDIDYWKPTDEDMAAIDLRKKADPRIKQSAPADISDKIITAMNDISNQEVPLEMTIAGRYLERALDYCETFPAAEHSKDNLREAWPMICTQKKCKLKDTYCGRVKAVGERTVQAAQRLAQGLQYMVKLKDSQRKDDPLGAFLLAARLMLPYSGVISQAYMREEGVFNNPNLAARGVMRDIEAEVRQQFGAGDAPGPLVVALAYAAQGRLDDQQYHPKPEWKFVMPLLEGINKEAKQ